MTRKHFRELVTIIVDNKLNDKAIEDIVRFCKRHNRNFCKQTFYDAIQDYTELVESAWQIWGYRLMIRHQVPTLKMWVQFLLPLPKLNRDSYKGINFPLYFLL